MSSHGCFLCASQPLFPNVSVIRHSIPLVNLIPCSFKGWEGVRALQLIYSPYYSQHHSFSKYLIFNFFFYFKDMDYLYKYEINGVLLCLCESLSICSLKGQNVWLSMKNNLGVLKPTSLDCRILTTYCPIFGCQNVFINLNYFHYSKLFFRLEIYFGHLECVKEFLAC